MKIILQLIVFLLLSTPAFSVDDCKHFNSVAFFEYFDEEKFYLCLDQNNGQNIWSKDKSGSIPLFKAIASEIDPTYIDDFFNWISEDQWQDLLQVKDNLGRNSMMIAIEEAPYWQTLSRLISFGGDIFQEVSPDNTILDLAINTEGAEQEVALLSLLGSVPYQEENRFNFDENNAILYPQNWAEKSFASFYAGVSIEAFQKCSEITEPVILEFLKPGELKYCIQNDDTFLEKIDRFGNTFLHLVATQSSDPTLIDLVFYATDIENRTILASQTNQDGHTALHLAAMKSKNSSVITRLIAWGGDPNFGEATWLSNPLKTRRLTMPIHLAAARDDSMAPEIILRLLAGGANSFHEDEEGNTALHIVLKRQEAFPDTIGLLLMAQDYQKSIFKRKIPEPQNLKGATPLAYASVKNDNYWIIAELISFGADPDIADQEGWTPLLLYAATGTDPDTFELLLINSKDRCEMKVTDGKSKGTTVNAALKSNEMLTAQLTAEGKYPMAVFKEACPF